MILAEVESYLSRPIAPTRRVALGDVHLPCDPAPGFGGVLLGAIAARFGSEMDADLHEELAGLMIDLEAGQRIAQPRLRHRFQTDRVGLQRCKYQLIGHGESLSFHFDAAKGTPSQHVLCAVYAAGTLPPGCVPAAMATLRKGFEWVGGETADLIRFLSGRNGPVAASSVGDPVGWALMMLDMQHEVVAVPTRRDVQRAFRQQLRAAHPDHGATGAGAAKRIAEISEARRILLNG